MRVRAKDPRPDNSTMDKASRNGPHSVALRTQSPRSKQTKATRMADYLRYATQPRRPVASAVVHAGRESSRILIRRHTPPRSGKLVALLDGSYRPRSAALAFGTMARCQAVRKWSARWHGPCGAHRCLFVGWGASDAAAMPSRRATAREVATTRGHLAQCEACSALELSDVSEAWSARGKKKGYHHHPYHSQSECNVTSSHVRDSTIFSAMSGIIKKIEEFL